MAIAKVTYDDRSFLVDGRRIWLVSGSVHYFRTPAELWRDRLLKAARAGLNCISTPVPWNFHEPSEGQWNLTDDAGVAEFVTTAADLGLYVILRPGPYIGADWDMGGLPSWLMAKSGVSLRGSNAAYSHYFDKYFRQVLTGLADLQVSRGGNIILIQNEHEYYMTTMPDRITYLEFVNQLFRRSGFDIPIISCNRFSPAVNQATELCGTEGTIFTATDATNPFQSWPMAVYTNKSYTVDTLPKVLKDYRWPQLFWVEDIIEDTVRNRWVPICPPRSPNNYERMMAHFLDCLINDTEPLTSGEDGARAVEVMCATLKSMETDAWVNLPLDEEIIPPHYEPLPGED